MRNVETKANKINFWKCKAIDERYIERERDKAMLGYNIKGKDKFLVN